MTIEELLDCSPDKLEKMTDKELIEFFTPYLQFVRPDPTKKQPAKSTPLVSKKAMADKANRLIDMFEKKFGEIQ